MKKAEQKQANTLQEDIVKNKGENNTNILNSTVASYRVGAVVTETSKMLIWYRYTWAGSLRYNLMSPWMLADLLS